MKPGQVKQLFSLFVLGFFACAWGFGATAQTVQIVDIVPHSNSDEVAHDSEPCLTVNLANPQQMVATAFTPDPGGGANAPLYFSLDGGGTWTLNPIFPGNNPTYGTGDVTVRFGGTSGVLYAGILRGDSWLVYNLLRTADFTSPAVMDILKSTNPVDQPHMQALTALGGLDRGFAGLNDFNVAGPGRKTASMDLSQDAATAPAPAGFSRVVLESRNTGAPNQDGPPIVTAYSLDGTVYSAFYGYTGVSGSADVMNIVVVRDDAWGTGSFTVLKDPSDTLPGRIVVSGSQFTWGTSLGSQRLVNSDLAIAVDPRNSSIVYVAWDDQSGPGTYTLHVRRSLNRGANWSGSDLLTVTTAKSPALAINSQGRVGLLYQQLTGSPGSERWEAHFRSSTGGAWDDTTLANSPNNNPPSVGTMYTGDYAHMMAVGKNFHGIFSTSNDDTPGNFPAVEPTFLRNHDVATHHMRNISNTADVSTSIDPFVFKITYEQPFDDFYVRDWTDGSGSDTGMEPSTHAVFYVSSDVWNRRSTTSGSPADSAAPTSEPIGNGTGNLGDNWLFARVSRRATGAASATTVTAHFLVANFGIGNPYVDASDAGLGSGIDIDAGDPGVMFGASDPGPMITPALHWHLDPIGPTHFCLAVEIDSPNDAKVAPSLHGQAPGWPTTDLRVINDNNKAQRNVTDFTMTPPTGSGTGSGLYALVHNAATFRRDLKILISFAPGFQGPIPRWHVDVVGGKSTPLSSPKGGSIVLPGMEPGENRWIGVIFDGPFGKDQPVYFTEVVGDTAVNGFAVRPVARSAADVIADNVVLAQTTAARFKAVTETDVLGSTPRSVSAQEYLSYLKAQLPGLRKASSSADPFSLRQSLVALGDAVSKGNLAAAANAHRLALEKINAELTMRVLARGSVADILQTVRLQRDMFASSPRLSRSAAGQAVVAASIDFIQGYTDRKMGAKGYSAFVRSVLDPLAEAAKEVGVGTGVGGLQESLGNPAALQKAHRDLLIAIEHKI